MEALAGSGPVPGRASPLSNRLINANTALL